MKTSLLFAGIVAISLTSGSVLAQQSPQGVASNAAQHSQAFFHQQQQQRILYYLRTTQTFTPPQLKQLNTLYETLDQQQHLVGAPINNTLYKISQMYQKAANKPSPGQNTRVLQRLSQSYASLSDQPNSFVGKGFLDQAMLLLRNSPESHQQILAGLKKTRALAQPQQNELRQLYTTLDQQIGAAYAPTKIQQTRRQTQHTLYQISTVYQNAANKASPGQNKQILSHLYVGYRDLSDQPNSERGAGDLTQAKDLLRSASSASQQPQNVISAMNATVQQVNLTTVLTNSAPQKTQTQTPTATSSELGRPSQ